MIHDEKVRKPLPDKHNGRLTVIPYMTDGLFLKQGITFVYLLWLVMVNLTLLLFEI